MHIKEPAPLFNLHIFGVQGAAGFLCVCVCVLEATFESKISFCGDYYQFVFGFHSHLYLLEPANDILIA